MSVKVPLNLADRYRWACRSSWQKIIKRFRCTTFCYFIFKSFLCSVGKNRLKHYIFLRSRLYMSCWRYQIAGVSRAGITDRNTKQSAAGSFLTDQHSLTGFDAESVSTGELGASLSIALVLSQEPLVNKCIPLPDIHFSRNGVQIGNLPILPVQSKLGQDAVQYLKILPIQCFPQPM